MEETKPKLMKKVSTHFPMAREIEAEFNDAEEIHIRDPVALRTKIAAMRLDGLKKLHVLTDFDYTLTRKTYEGQKADNSFKTIENVRGE